MDNNILKNGGKLKRENKTKFLAKRGKKEYKKSIPQKQNLNHKSKHNQVVNQWKKKIKIYKRRFDLVVFCFHFH